MKKTLIVIDMQNDFIDGALGTEKAKTIVKSIKAKIAQYVKAGDEIIFTRDTHSKNYLNTLEGKKLPVIHCVKNTEGWEIAKGLVTENSIIIDKTTFGYMGWAKMDFKEIQLVGLYTDICVVSNALILRSAFPEIKITVDAACCAGTTSQGHREAIDIMKMCQIDIVNYGKKF